MKYTLNKKLLHLDKVGFSYDGKTAILKDVSMSEFDVQREGGNTGQFIAVLGASGRGKSTLFKIITGLLEPSEGLALISDGTDNPNGAKAISEGDVGFVDQKYTLFRHKTVTQILMYALRKTQKTSEEKKLLINEYLINWGLIKQKDQYPNELSGGQKQRTAIIEQIFTSGKYIVFDEPASGLDVGSIEKLKTSFHKIGEQDDLNTVIFSTHDINLAVELADSIYIIGHPTPESEYSTVVNKYDLKELGLAWTPFGSGHLELVEKIKNDIKNS